MKHIQGLRIYNKFYEKLIKVRIRAIFVLELIQFCWRNFFLMFIPLYSQKNF